MNGTNGNWLKVNYGNTTGYVIGKYINRGNPPKPIVKAKPIVKPKPKIQTVFYNVQPINAYYAYIGYKEPSNNSSAVITLRERTKVNVTGQSGDWKRIQYGSTVGYVNKYNLQSDLVTLILQSEV
ncbi:MAG: hypothetical protein K0Q87_3662 [Neobacillus sp.]|nr:hypothetical protein [Neobacillus sp.]